MYFQAIIKTDKKKPEINSGSCAYTHTKIPEKVTGPEFSTGEIRIFMHKPNVANIAKEGAVNFESKKLEEEETVLQVRFKLYVTKAIRELEKII